MLALNGELYGTTASGGTGPYDGFGVVFKLTPPAQGQTGWTETVLYRFQGGSDGSTPVSTLIAGKDGALFGTTAEGGGAATCPYSDGSCGTVFKLTPPAKGETSWTETVLHRFTGIDGAEPEPFSGRLIADEEGSLYGTTTVGGSANNGTVFKLAPPRKGETAWKETVLYSFCSSLACADGSLPGSSLILDNDGALYGTTTGGGSGAFISGGGGTLFKLTPPTKGETAWRESVLYNFCSKQGCSDGVQPLVAPIVGKDGALYGTTDGDKDAASGHPGENGTVFRLGCDLTKAKYCDDEARAVDDGREGGAVFQTGE